MREDNGTVSILDDIVNSQEMKWFVQKRMDSSATDLFDYAGVISNMIFEKTGVERSFPVDIRKMVERCGIKVSETNLNADIGFELERINGYLKEYEEEWRIFLEVKDSELVKRYVLAHELSHYFIDKASRKHGAHEEVIERHCIDPFFSKNSHEVMSDVLAVFLVFPPDALLKYLEQYTEEMKKKNIYPIDSYDWLCALGQKAQISTYFTIMSYQYMKVYMCGLYQKKPRRGLVVQYEKFFK